MEKLYLALSFDHELSLGGSRRSYADDLFNPTATILDIADSFSVPVTLFSDVLCGIKFREWKVADFYKPYEAQLQKYIHCGHDVQLHIHPHWLNTSINNGKYNPSQKFSLNDFRDDIYPNNIYGIIERGVNFLNTVCKPINYKYQCIAFRAGGYKIHPSAEAILSALWENGIRIDSSIAKGYRFKSNISEVDFSDMPQQANWHIPLQGPINSQCSNGMFEVPIVTIPRTPINNMLFLVKRFFFKSKKTPKTYIGLHEKHTSILQKLNRLIPFSAWMLSFDICHNSAATLINILSSYINQHKNDKVIFASAVSHPKSMNNYNFELMQNFIKEAINKFGDKIVFCKYQDIYNLIATESGKKTYG